MLIELPNFKPTSITAKKVTVLWLRFLKEINEKTVTVDPSLLEVDSIKEALSLLEISSYSEAELLAYDKSWDAVSSERTLLSGRYKEGKAEGRAEGRAEGEMKAKIEMVCSLHQLGISIEQIATAAKLSHKEVQKLLEN